MKWHFQNDKKIASNEKTPSFRKKTKSFVSKNEVLAPLTLRFLEKRRRFPTVKTPSFFSCSSIHLQTTEIQFIAKPSNTWKNFKGLALVGFFVSHEVNELENR